MKFRGQDLENSDFYDVEKLAEWLVDELPFLTYDNKSIMKGVILKLKKFDFNDENMKIKIRSQNSKVSQSIDHQQTSKKINLRYNLGRRK